MRRAVRGPVIKVRAMRFRGWIFPAAAGLAALFDAPSGEADAVRVLLHEGSLDCRVTEARERDDRPAI